MGRRKFISRLLSYVTLLPGVQLLITACGGSSGGGGGSTTAPTTPSDCSSAGTALTSISTDSNNQIRLCLNTYSNLNSVGGTYRLFVTTQSGATRTISVSVLNASTVTAVSAVCTHQGCTIGGFSSGAQTYTCPCHSSVFNGDGTVNTGPAATSLTTYPTTLSVSEVLVTVT